MFKSISESSFKLLDMVSCCTAACVLLCLLSIPINASEMVGQVGILKGSVHATSDSGEKRKLSAGDELFHTDKIEVSVGGFLKALLKDDTIISLDENSTFTFDDYNINDKNDKKIQMNLQQGKLRVLVTNKVKKGHVRLKTKNLTLGVRGTQFLVSAIPDGTNFDTDVAVLSGRVNLDVSGYNLPGVDNVDLGAGRAFNSKQVKADGNLSSVKPLPASVLYILRRNSGAFLPKLKVVVSTDTPNIDGASGSDQQEGSRENDTQDIDDDSFEQTFGAQEGDDVSVQSASVASPLGQVMQQLEITYSENLNLEEQFSGVEVNTEDITSDINDQVQDANDTTNEIIPIPEEPEQETTGEVTGDITGGETTGDVTGDITGGETTGDITGGETTGEVTGEVTGDITGGETTGDVTGGTTTGDVTGGTTTGDVTGGTTTGDVTGGTTTGDVTGGTTTGDVTGGDNGGGSDVTGYKNYGQLRRDIAAVKNLRLSSLRNALLANKHSTMLLESKNSNNLDKKEGRIDKLLQKSLESGVEANQLRDLINERLAASDDSIISKANAHDLIGDLDSSLDRSQRILERAESKAQAALAVISDPSFNFDTRKNERRLERIDSGRSKARAIASELKEKVDKINKSSIQEDSKKFQDEIRKRIQERNEEMIKRFSNIDTDIRSSIKIPDSATNTRKITSQIKKEAEKAVQSAVKESRSSIKKEVQKVKKEIQKVTVKSKEIREERKRRNSKK